MDRKVKIYIERSDAIMESILRCIFDYIVDVLGAFCILYNGVRFIVKGIIMKKDV